MCFFYSSPKISESEDPSIRLLAELFILVLRKMIMRRKMMMMTARKQMMTKIIILVMTGTVMLYNEVTRYQRGNNEVKLR